MQEEECHDCYSLKPVPESTAPLWTLAVLSLSLLLVELDSTILNVALPTLQREFDASASALQWLVASYILVFAGLLLFMGALGDRFGRKRALLAGFLCSGSPVSPQATPAP